MECSLDAKILSNIVDATIELSTYVNIDVSEEGWDVQATNMSRLALFSFSLNKDSFLNLRVTRPATVCINLSALKKVIKTMKSVNLMHLKLNNGMLDIVGECEGKNIQCELKTMEIQSEQLTVPQMEFEYVVNLPSVEFVQTCQTVFGETVCIQAGSDIVFTSKGKDGNSHVQYTGAVIKSSGEFTLEFASRYLTLFSKGLLMSKMVVIGMSPNAPISIEFSVAGGHMCYFLAPGH